MYVVLFIVRCLSSKSQRNGLHNDYDRCRCSGYEGERGVGDDGDDDDNGENCSGDNRD
jgi:hypothetical protein